MGLSLAAYWFKKAYFTYYFFLIPDMKEFSQV